MPLQELLDMDCFKPYDNSWVQPLTPAQKRAAREASIVLPQPPVVEEDEAAE